MGRSWGTYSGACGTRWQLWTFMGREAIVCVKGEKQWQRHLWGGGQGQEEYKLLGSRHGEIQTVLFLIVGRKHPAWQKWLGAGGEGQRGFPWDAQLQPWRVSRDWKSSPLMGTLEIAPLLLHRCSCGRGAPVTACGFDFCTSVLQTFLSEKPPFMSLPLQHPPTYC